MVEEPSAGAAHLVALKQSGVEQGAAEAPARSAQAASPAETKDGQGLPPSGALPSGREKRRSPRYRCQGSARLREIKTGMATWATFSDISVHGCYVETSSSYQVGAELALTIEVNGLKVEGTGEVRVAYPGLGIGIAFTTLTAENWERLRGLVRSVSQPSAMLSSQVLPLFDSLSSPVPLQGTANPHAALEALVDFFQDRNVLGRDEFFRILRKSQTAGR
jgi:hypothetical protein